MNRLRISRALLRTLVIALVALFLGAALTAAIVGFIPDSGSAPAIYDDFNWSSTANGFWHVNADGGTERIKNGALTLAGHSIELDRRLQTDPYTTVVSARVRSFAFKRFGIGIGVYHSGTVGMEFDDEGVKCGRATDHGWQVDSMKSWPTKPVGQWFYLRVAVTNPYPNPDVFKKMGDIDPYTLKHVHVLCALWDSAGHLLKTDDAKNPPPNTHYVALDEAFVRIWDSHNKYQLDWFYAGPPSGDPTRTLQGSGGL